MRRHDDCRSLTVDPIQESHDPQRGLRIEVSGGLVREEELGAVHHRTCDRNTLFFAAGELMRKALLADDGRFLPVERLAERFGAVGL